MESEEMGQRIKLARNNKSISAVELAGITGLSKATIHRYESGDIKTIKIPVIETIAKYLGVNPQWLLCKTDDPTNHERPIEKDLQVILAYALKIIRSTEFTNNGKPVPQEAVEVIELAIEYSLSILQWEEK